MKLKPRTITSIDELNKLHSKKELTGLFELPNELYHSGPGLSSTQLKKLITDPPAKFLEPNKKSDALDFVQLKNRIRHVHTELQLLHLKDFYS